MNTDRASPLFTRIGRTGAPRRQVRAATAHRAPAHWADDRCADDLRDHPIVFVTWRDANAYATWATKSLPTSEHWERAARGTRGAICPWGNQPTVRQRLGMVRHRDRTWPPRTQGQRLHQPVPPRHSIDVQRRIRRHERRRHKLPLHKDSCEHCWRCEQTGDHGDSDHHPPSRPPAPNAVHDVPGRRRHRFWQTKMAVPGMSRPRSGLQPPQIRSCSSGHSGSTRSRSSKPAATTSRTRSPIVR